VVARTFVCWLWRIGISRYVTLFTGDEIYQTSPSSSAYELCSECWKFKYSGRTSESGEL